MRLASFAKPFVALAAGIALGLAIAFGAGESPLRVLQILAASAFGTPYDFGMTLYYTTPLIFTGLAVGLAYQAGLFNIGAEGQLTMGAMAATIVGLWWPGLPMPWSLLAAAVAAFIGGALWGLIPGWLLAKRGSHEVITTIMLNFIAVGVTSYLALYVFKDPNSQSPETLEVGPGFRLEGFSFFDDAPAGISLVIAVASCIVLHWLLRRSLFGYELRAVGLSESVARAAGMRPENIKMWALVLAGGLAGLVGLPEILDNAYRFRVGFSPGYGFTGIAVALLCRGRPLPIILSAFLFGALFKGATDLDFETEVVTKELSALMQAFIILFVSAQTLGWHKLRRRKVGA